LVRANQVIQWHAASLGSAAYAGADTVRLIKD
jgi:hypothetical protein